MVTKLSHIPIFVLNQTSAFDFYVNKLGFEVRTDFTMDNGFRWLTVGPATQPDLEIILMPIESPMANPEGVEHMKKLLELGVLGAGVFNVDDCQATYEELKAKGVEFKGEPVDQFYGVEVIMKDDSGNWFSMTQPKAH